MVHTAPAQYNDATDATRRRCSELRPSAEADRLSLSHTRGCGMQHPPFAAAPVLFIQAIGRFVVFDSQEAKATGIGSLCRHRNDGCRHLSSGSDV